MVRIMDNTKYIHYLMPYVYLYSGMDLELCQFQLPRKSQLHVLILEPQFHLLSLLKASQGWCNVMKIIN